MTDAPLIDCGDLFEVTALNGPYDDGSWDVTLFGEYNDQFVIRGRAIPTEKIVYVVAESKVYHRSSGCPGLSWLLNHIQRGLLQEDGSIELLGSGVYRGRRPCKRCAR